MGVGALGDDMNGVKSGHFKLSHALFVYGEVVGTLSADVGAPLAGVNQGFAPIQVKQELVNLINSADTSVLTELARYSGWDTPTQRIAEAFPNAASGSLVYKAGATRLRLAGFEMEVSLLKYLSLATVYSRTGRFYTATSLNSAGTALAYHTHCGVLRDGCFVLPNYTSPSRQTGTGFAAPRLSAMLDTVWIDLAAPHQPTDAHAADRLH